MFCVCMNNATFDDTFGEEKKIILARGADPDPDFEKVGSGLRIQMFLKSNFPCNIFFPNYNLALTSHIT